MGDTTNPAAQTIRSAAAHAAAAEVTLRAGAGEAGPAYLFALNPSLVHREYTIGLDGVTVGRDADSCEVVCSGKTISRRHCAISTPDAGRTFTLTDLNSTNGVFVNGEQVKGVRTLSEGDLIGLGSAQIEHLRFQHESGRNRSWSMTLPAQPQWTIGRGPDNDIALAFESTVSSRHAVVRLRGGRAEVNDLNSLNGTWVNGKRVRRAAVEPTDAVMIGSTILRFEVSPDGGLQVVRRDCGDQIALESVALTREVRGGKRILDRVTLSIKPGEFVGLLGPSGAGKSTLLKALNGYTPPEFGCVLLNEMPLYPCFDMFRNAIGYVPQDDIVHPELTVEQSLHYVAKLRLPPDVPMEQRKDLIDSTIETLGLSHVRQSRINELSGGQRKRVSIGCELITRPSVLFLDEPTSGMDPSTEERLMRHFKEMAHRGTTVLITTHILYNLDLLDRVVILARGRLVFFGTPKEAMEFFKVDGKPVERPTQIFEVLEAEHAPELKDEGDPKNAVAKQCAENYKGSPLYEKHVRQEQSQIGSQLEDVSEGGEAATTTVRNLKPLLTKPTAGGGRKLSLDMFSPRAFWTLTRRNLAIKLVSPKRALFYLAVPLVLALVTLSLNTAGFPDDAEMTQVYEDLQHQIHGSFTVYNQTVDLGEPIKELLSPDPETEERAAEDILYSLKHEGLPNLPTPLSVLLMFVMTSVFMGTLMSCLDLSTERPIYIRERMANQRIADYLLSKLPFLLMVTAIQCLVFLALTQLKPGLRSFDFGSAYLAMVAMAWTACAIGLFLSAIDPTAGQFSVILAIVVVLPQLVFSGGLGPDFYEGMPGGMKALANIFPARWGLEMLMTAFYHHPDRTAVDWIPDFVRDTIGFTFGPGVYLRNVGILLAQSVIWLGLCAFALKRMEKTR